MSECKRCGKLNPAEIHTCTPSVEYLHQRLALKDLEIMRLREALIYHTQQTRPIHQTEQALSTPATYDDLMAWHNEQLGEPVAWIKPDFLGRGYAELDELHEYKFSPMTINHNAIPLYAKKG